MTARAVVLPPLEWERSPNFSSRHGHPITHLVWHATAGPFGPSLSWLRNPAADASCHAMLEEHGAELAQLVKLADKAWHAYPTWNACGVGVEHASEAAGFATHEQLEVSARVFGWLCLHLGIPPVHGLHRPRGIVRHRDLGAGGGNHSDGPSDRVWFHEYLPAVQRELARGGFRKEYLR